MYPVSAHRPGPSTILCLSGVESGSEYRGESLRSQGSLSSDIATIAGLNPHKSAFQLYLEKVGEAEEAPETEAQLFGTLFEAATAAVYAHKHGCRLDEFADILTHPKYDFLTANPDRVVVDLERLIEIKTTGMGGIKHWETAEAGGLTPPQHVILQANWYLGFLGWEHADILLLQFCEGFTHPDRYVEFAVAFDPELFELSEKLAVNFWQNHVLARVPPEAVDAEEVSDYLTRIYKAPTDEIIDSTVELDQAAARLKYATEQETHWKQQKIIEDNALKGAIGDKAGIRGKDWVYTWKKTKSGGVDWQRLAESHQLSPQDLEQFTRPGYRRKYFRYRGKAVE
jgi:putative phage-type endonuclease